MPYQNNKDLPNLGSLPEHGKTIYRKAFNASFEKYGEDAARKIAWSAVKSKYHKDKNDKWVENSLVSKIEEFSMLIVKAAIDDQGRMYWKSTASDTLLDAFEQRMTIELYESFIRNRTGKEYLSLAHYPRLNGKGEIGVLESLYIDGNQLKAFGYFHDSPIGKACYNAVRKDRREEKSQVNRIRTSIGFWDIMHKHVFDGKEFIWQAESGQKCVQCALGTKGKFYLAGVCDHLALTRIPANKRTDIDLIEEY